MTDKSISINVVDVYEVTEKKKNVDFEEALEYTGFGRYNITLIIACGICLINVNNEAYSIGYVMPSMACEMNLNNSYKGILTSANFIGIMATCCIWGYLSDTRGRRNLQILSLCLSFVTSFIAPFMSSFWGFCILRLLNGIFISGPSAVTFAYFAEFQSKTYRAKAMAVISVFISLALVALPGLGWLLLPGNVGLSVFGFQLSSWRLYMLVVSFVNIIAVASLVMFPESPAFLNQQGRYEEALEILKQIYATNTKKSKNTFPVESLDEKKMFSEMNGIKNDDNTYFLKNVWKKIAPIFERPHLKYILTGGILQAIIFAISSGLYMWYPYIVNQISNTEYSNSSLSVCQALDLPKPQVTEECTISENIFIQNILIGITYMFGYILWVVLVKILGNRLFYMIYVGVATAGIVVLTFITNGILINVLFMIVLTLPGILVAVVNTITVELVPTSLCGMAICLIMTCGRIGSIVSTSVIGTMLDFNCSVTFLLFGASLLISLFLAFIFPRKQNNS